MCLNVFYATSAYCWDVICIKKTTNFSYVFWTCILIRQMLVADYLSIFYLVSKIVDQLIIYVILTDSGNILEETEKVVVISYNKCKKKMNMSPYHSQKSKIIIS